jgi:hypothetical protein
MLIKCSGCRRKIKRAMRNRCYGCGRYVCVRCVRKRGHHKEQLGVSV